MTIHDELILELIKPDKLGNPTGNIIEIIGTSNLRYRLELSRDTTANFETISTITPDIVVINLNSKDMVVSNRESAIELENDIQWE